MTFTYSYGVQSTGEVKAIKGETLLLNCCKICCQVEAVRPFAKFNFCFVSLYAVLLQTNIGRK